ncbi:hypothetical protein HYC85_018050 [Camellia sinensis]|uniref:Uncharacterized protein n=1 Tax=Camellia sinensis TaxID=4442 RepID=A0A7J7GT69_CAMSI|nr:hypothetical protein HYC85_018050 [Camellia sinensis]
MSQFFLYQTLTRDTSIPQHIEKGIARGDIEPFSIMPFQVLFLNLTSFEKQGVNNGASLVVDRTYHLKDFKPEVRAMPFVFPLTAIGFASFETKRRFRAPRSAPKHPSPINETSRPVEHVTKEAAACKTNCSPASLLDSRYLAIASSADDYVDNGVVTESPESLESPRDGLHGKKDTLGAKRSSQDPLLQQSRHSTHKACMTLHKEFEWKSTSDVDEGETRIQNTKVTMRSSYFQQKLAKENDEENQNENLLGKEDVSTDKCENVNLDCKNKSALVVGEVKARIKNRKTMVRSSYFPHKPVNEGDQDSRQEKRLVNADLTTSTCENAILEIIILPCMALPDLLVRGYGIVSMDVSVDVRVDVSVMWGHGDGYRETKAEGGEFGCNISHLANYSNIAEKSMEKFVSVISSFRCSSSGSRANGLCAPLKDVQNTCTSR